MRCKSFFQFFSWFALLTLVWIDDAYAYLDPGVGSMLFQSLVAAVAGGVFILKTYWSKLKSFFSRDVEKPKSENEN